MNFNDNGLENLILLSKTELRSICAEILLLDTEDIWKDNMIKIVSDAILNDHGDATNGILTLIDEEGR